MMKRNLVLIILLVLCLVMPVGCSAGAAQNEEDATLTGTAGLEYQLTSDNEGYVCTGIGNAATTDIVIPATYKGKPVLMVANNAFYNCVTLTSVTIAEGVQAIELYAFRGCVRLKSVSIPGSVLYVGDRAFEDCTSLVTVTIADNPKVFDKPEEDVRMIGESTFKGCTALKELRLPEELTLLSRRMLDACASIETITLPAAVKAIDEAALAGCTALKTIHFPGTKEEWSKLPKGMLWDVDVEGCVVVCSDGETTMH